MSVALKKVIEAMNECYDTTTPEGKSQVIEAYREAVKSEAGLSTNFFLPTQDPRLTGTFYLTNGLKNGRAHALLSLCK